jgi:putative membrane protein insertion efficiency factor
MRRFLIGLIRGYQVVISPHLGQCCRFHPSCSCYAAEAIHRHGPFKGLWLSVWRLLRCNPYNQGGIDPVP